MYSRVLLLVIFPVFCDSKITINITVAADENDVIVIGYGEANHVVTERDKDLFNLTMDNLNRGVRVELGKVPDGIFLKDPTPYGNLFKKYKWPEAYRNIRVEKAEVTELINEKVALKTHEHINNSTDAVKSVRSLFEAVEESVRSSWSKYGLTDEDIMYDVAVNFGSDTFKYENRWRNSSLRSISSKFGRRKKGLITVKSGQTVVTRLVAYKTVISIRIDYKTKIIGNLITDYENLYGKYHFYAPTVENIMKAAKLSNEIKTTETIEIVCYTEPDLEVYDKYTGVEVKSDRPKRLFGNLKRNKKI